MPRLTPTATRAENNAGNAPAGWLAPANAPILARFSPVYPPYSPRPTQSMKSKFLSVKVSAGVALGGALALGAVGMTSSKANAVMITSNDISDTFECSRSSTATQTSTTKAVPTGDVTVDFLHAKTFSFYLPQAIKDMDTANIKSIKFKVFGTIVANDDPSYTDRNTQAAYFNGTEDGHNVGYSFIAKTIDPNAGPSGGAWYEFDVSAMRGAIDETSPVTLKIKDTDRFLGTLFSNNASDPDHAPQLVFEIPAVPEPSALGLLGVAAAIAVSRRPNRKPE